MHKPTDKKSYIVSGIFVFILCTVIVITVLMINKENPLFSSNIKVFTEVTNVQNLKEGAAIQLRGLRVGSVKEINIKDLEKIRITLGIESKYGPWIKEDSEINFKTQGVLGDKFLEITGGTAEAKEIDDGSVLLTNENSKLDHIINKSDELMTAASSLINRLDLMIAKVDHGNLAKILSNLEKVTKTSNDILTGINQQELKMTIKNMGQSSDSLSRLTKRIEEGPGSLHALIYDQGLHEDLRTLIGGANRNKVLKFFIRESIKKNEN